MRQEKIIVYLLLLLAMSGIYPALGQIDTFPSRPVKATDSLGLPSVIVKGYLHNQTLEQTPTSVGVVDALDIDQNLSMVGALNNVTGVRMEERSPSSFRLSIRGSLIRSPYGVRNVKVYYNGLSLTDGGGNTYLNVLDFQNLGKVEILKGPDGSLFGANSGGVMLLHSKEDSCDQLKGAFDVGAWGYLGYGLNYTQKKGKHLVAVRQSFSRSDGYRQNTFNRRLFLQLTDRWTYGKGVLDITGFYASIHYQTPGGLTKAQYDSMPTMARPSSNTLPGAVEQKAGIYTDMFLIGATNRNELSSSFSFYTSAWFSYVNFKNPFITNYETRLERNNGLRAYFTYHNSKVGDNNIQPVLDFGLERQEINSSIHNYNNNKGSLGSLQAATSIVSRQFFPFFHGRINWGRRLVTEMAASLNYNRYRFRDSSQGVKTFDPAWMPHLAASYLLSDFLTLRLTFSKGYSVPTTAEVRPSDNRIYTGLEPEQGWNKELGTRWKIFEGRLWIDASYYIYRLDNGIVSQQDESGNTYFSNTGKIKQHGFEMGSTMIFLRKRNKGVIRFLDWKSNLSIYDYRLDSYRENGVDYSGKKVAGVPQRVWTNVCHFDLAADFSILIQDNLTSRIFLNNANAVFAQSYHLLYCRMGKKIWAGRHVFSVYVSMDNVLNQKYSLGNDLNAVGGRYFNAAPTRNLQIGFSCVF